MARGVVCEKRDVFLVSEWPSQQVLKSMGTFSRAQRFADNVLETGQKDAVLISKQMRICRRRR